MKSAARQEFRTRPSTTGAKICGADALGDETSAAARRGECQGEADRRGPVIGQGHAPGRAVKKALGPAGKRKLVDTVKADWKVSIRRVCSVLKIDQSLRFMSTSPGVASRASWLKIGDICQTRVRYGYRRVYVLLDGTDGLSIRSESIAFTRRWTSSSATRFANDGSKRSCGLTARSRPIPTMSGRWISFTTSWLQAATSGF